MASATATATMAAAAGFDKRASTASSLQTPGSGSFPSELLSPMVNSPGLLKKDDLKTPITPPSAYLDFLKNMSPAMLSPAPSSNSARFSFNDVNWDKPAEPLSAKRPASPPTSQPQPQPQPALSRNSSYDSNASAHSNASNTSNASNQSAPSHHSSRSNSTSSGRQRPESPRIIIPPSPFAKPAPRSARTPRIHIPQSPLNPALNSAHSVSSPYSAAGTPLNGAPWSASFSPREADPETNGKPGKVSVRQVVTRTVTYCRTPVDPTPLDPAPRGKRRKVEVEELSSKEPSEEPPVKQEKLDDEDSTPLATQPSQDA